MPVITDAFSKMTELAAIESKSAITVALAIYERWFCRYGVPKVLVTDRGTEFVNYLRACVS